MGPLGQKSFTIRLNVNEGKIVFQALAELPFKYVYELIGKINSQANENVAYDCDEKALHRYRVNRQELELMIRALGEMPFNRVHRLVEELNAQIGEQIGN